MILLLPFPPSVNGMFTNVRGRGRVPTKRYKLWRDEASFMLMQQPTIKFEGRADIIISLSKGRSNSDCDNYIKAVLDCLVTNGILEDDSKPFVRSVTSRWDDENVQNGIMVEITPVE